jgi:hypothetical protein
MRIAVDMSEMSVVYEKLLAKLLTDEKVIHAIKIMREKNTKVVYYPDDFEAIEDNTHDSGSLGTVSSNINQDTSNSTSNHLPKKCHVFLESLQFYMGEKEYFLIQRYAFQGPILCNPNQCSFSVFNILISNIGANRQFYSLNCRNLYVTKEKLCPPQTKNVAKYKKDFKVFKDIVNSNATTTICWKSVGKAICRGHLLYEIEKLTGNWIYFSPLCLTYVYDLKKNKIPLLLESISEIVNQ